MGDILGSPRSCTWAKKDLGGAVTWGLSFSFILEDFGQMTRVELIRVHRKGHYLDDLCFNQEDREAYPDQNNETKSETELGIVPFKKLSIDGHHTSFTFNGKDSVYAVRVNFIDDVWSFPLRFKLSLRFVSEDHRSSYCRD